MMRALKLATLTVAFLAMLWGAGLWLFVRAIPPAIETPAGHYDAIIALTGGKDRIPRALALLQAGKAEVLFISGVPDGFRFQDLASVGDVPGKSAMAALRPRIFYGEHARDTIGNAEETMAWLKGKPYRTLLIVTANYHIPRTRLLFSHYLPGYALDYASVDPPQFNRLKWLSHANSSRLIFSEYHKLVATWIKLTLP
jgi:uncharacterized SAM-binding protein YcdF (DUF218 family)